MFGSEGLASQFWLESVSWVALEPCDGGYCGVFTVFTLGRGVGLGKRWDAMRL